MREDAGYRNSNQIMGRRHLSKLGNFVWGIADQLRVVYKPHQYGGVILPFTILRRLDCILESTRDEVRTLAGKYSGGALDVQVKRKGGSAGEPNPTTIRD
jgi:type I restriction enzyme M protein